MLRKLIFILLFVPLTAFAAKDYLNDYSATAGSNTDVGGVDVDEGSAPSALNDAIREVMSHLSGFKSEFEVGADVASASAADVDVAGVIHDITGTTGVTSLANPTNDTSHIKILQFNGIVTLTHSSNLLLGGSNVTTAAGDVLSFVYEGSSVWRLIAKYPVSTDLVTDLTPQLGGDLDANTYNILMDSGSSINDENDNEILFISSAASAVNELGIQNSATGNDVIIFSSGDDTNIDIDIQPKGSGKALYNGTEVATVGSSGITLGTPQASTSGTAITFGSIPSGTKKIIVSLVGVSTSGTSDITVRIGDSGGIETSGYVGYISNNATQEQFTTGFEIAIDTAAADVATAVVDLYLQDSSSFTWAEKSIRTDVGAVDYGAGSKSLSAELTQISITTEGGSDTFDAGSINIQYE